MKYTFNAATRFLGEYRGIKIKDKRRPTFSNLFLKLKFHESVRCFCARETGGGFKPNNFSENITGFINETDASVLAGKHLHGKIPSCATLETYKKMPIFIPIDIMEDAVESFAQKLLGGSVPGGT